MTAGGTASQRTKTYKTESATLSESVSRSSCKEVDITGVEVTEKKIITEGNKYRAYVVLALPTGDANVLRRAKENQRVQELAAKRSTEAFKELE